MTNMERALACASQGWLVFPSVGKRPLVKWSTESTTDETQIFLWWTEHPDADCSVATLAKVALMSELVRRYHTSGGRLISTLSIRAPVCSPKRVPRSCTRLNSA